MEHCTGLMVLSAAWVLVVASPFAMADAKLPAVIGDNMVLQREMAVPIWGKADPGEKVTVSLGSQRVRAKADEQGRWMVKLAPLEAGGPLEMHVTAKNRITRSNIFVGDVWVCSGQSNMAWRVQQAANPEAEIAAADHPNIRLFVVKKAAAEEPQDDTEGEWSVCNSQTVADFSAVGYYFGRELHKALDVPIGLIDSSVGGTPAEAWTSWPTLASEPDFKPILERWRQGLTEYATKAEEHRRALADWEKAVESAKADGKLAPPRPEPPPAPGPLGRPAGLYDGMITPLVPYAIRGVIWYQGESNVSRAYQYRTLLPLMIQDWRRTWGRPDLAFLFVQLANHGDEPAEPAESDWAELREAELMTLKLPDTAMAVAIDVGEAKDVHPRNKQAGGQRLALAAQAIAHHRDVVYSGPIYDSMKIEGDRIRLHFRHVNGGLVAKRSAALTGFAIAGEDRKFVWAEATIEGDTVIVRNRRVPKPAAVRYGWANNPACNLYNKAGLPASPFRTDDWPGVTVNAR